MDAPRPRFRIGYCTSGLAGHRLPEALNLLADLGYRGVFITLDVHHLDPLSGGVRDEVAAIKSILHTLDMEAVVETGARFILDPRRKHHPNLLSREGADRREAFLRSAIDIANELEAPCVSLWSGGNHDGLAEDEAYAILGGALGRLLDHAERAGVDLAFEPEPGMLIERVDQFHRLRDQLDGPRRLKLSLDCGHLLVTREGRPEDIIRAEKELLACVAIEDMKTGVHQHLPFGEGDLDLPPLIEALSEIGFAGVVAVELAPHSHEGPYQAARSRDVLQGLGVPFRDG